MRNFLRDLEKGINDAFDEKKLAAENAAIETAQKAIRQFRSRQMLSKQEPDGRLKQDTAKMRSAARQFALSRQGGPPVTALGEPWINRSFMAARSVFADGGLDDRGQLYIQMYHTQSYGAYLELARGRRFAVLEPIIRGLTPEFISKIKGIYSAD